MSLTFRSTFLERFTNKRSKGLLWMITPISTIRLKRSLKSLRSPHLCLRLSDTSLKWNSLRSSTDPITLQVCRTAQESLLNRSYLELASTC